MSSTRAAFFQSFATALSGPTRTRPRKIGEIERLARQWLCIALLSMPSACLVEDPPAYVAPKQTPPRLDYRRAEPRLDQIYVAKTNDTIPFRIRVASEDAGVKLFGIFLLDYAGGTATAISNPIRLPASTLDDDSRVLSASWVVPSLSFVPAGCHRITLRVTHETNVDIFKIPEIELIDPTDSAEAYWWVNIVDPDPDSADTTKMLVNCPTASRGSP